MRLGSDVRGGFEVPGRPGVLQESGRGRRGRREQTSDSVGKMSSFKNKPESSFKNLRSLTLPLGGKTCVLLLRQLLGAALLLMLLFRCCCCYC